MARRPRRVGDPHYVGHGLVGFDLVIEGDLAGLAELTNRKLQNAFKRGVSAALRVLRVAAAGYVAGRGWPQRWRNPNRGFRTSRDTRLTFEGRGGSKVVDKVDGKWRARPGQKPSGFRVVGSLYSKFPGNIYEAGQKAHWIPVDGHLLRWARRHGKENLLKARGLWIKRGGRKVFVPFKRFPRLEQWAAQRTVTVVDDRGGVRHRRLTQAATFYVHQQPPRPFVIPAAHQAEHQAREAFRLVIEEAVARG